MVHRHRGSHTLFSLLSPLLLACLVKLSASQGNECPTKRESTKEAAMEAFQVLYGDPSSSPSMPRQKVIKKLEILEPYFANPEFGRLHDYPVLGKLSCLEPSAEL